MADHTTLFLVMELLHEYELQINDYFFLLWQWRHYLFQRCKQLYEKKFKI